jgi:hypothetical protein
MSSIHFIPTTKATHSGLGSIIDDLKYSLEVSSSESDRKNIGATIEQLLQATRLFPSERSDLLALRESITNPQSVTTKATLGFWSGFAKALHDIDGEKFAKRLPEFLTLGLFAVAVSWFLWDQSVALYEAAKFSSPALAAAGATLMIVGFAGFHGLTKSKLALLLCLYVGGYEAYTVVSGTVKSEENVLLEAVDKIPEIAWLKEKASQASENYETVKSNFENSRSKVFHNQWYKTKFLSPAWNEFQSAQEIFLKERALTIQKQGSGHLTLLKVLYRLGLVFLSMMLIHQLARSISHLSGRRFQTNFS